MKKTIIQKNLKKDTKKIVKAFSNPKDKIWKTPKRKDPRYWYGLYWKASWPKRGCKSRYNWYKYCVTKLRRKRKKKRRWNRYLRIKKVNDLLGKFRRKTLFWHKLLKFYYTWLNEQDILKYSFDSKIKSRLNKKSSLIKNIVKTKIFKNKRALSIKKFLYQPSLYFFRKDYKRNFIKRNRGINKSFFFKSLEMNLIKFSLTDDCNWLHFFGANRAVLHFNPFYAFVKSKRIKFYLDTFIKSYLFNQIKNISFLYSRRHFQYIHNNRKIFEDLDTNKQKFPWWEALMFGQQTYRSRLSWKGQQFWFRKPFLLFTFKFYYRYKKPWEEKRKNPYSNFSYLVYNLTYKNVLEKPKRVKQLLNKIVLPFYGHIKPKQLRSIYKKSHFVKSQEITSSNLILNKLESRLDVLVYRLNLAPNVIWARRMIRAGLVFLQRDKLKENINNCFKKINLFPIKLNKSFDLYEFSLHDYRIKNFYFKTQPILSIDFKTKPGDIIQCHPFSLYQKWNIRPDLLNKPIPPHLLTKTKVDFNTEWNHWYRYLISNKKYLLLYNSRKKNRWKINNSFTPYRYEWDNELVKETTSIFLFPSQKNDFYVNERNSALFLSWVIK